jgi:hypothetical protein
MTKRIQSICDRINELESTHHVAIASLLKEEGNIKINENSNGIMVNMSLISETVLQKIEKFLDFISKQETQLKEFEDQIEVCKLNL